MIRCAVRPPLPPLTVHRMNYSTKNGTASHGWQGGDGSSSAGRILGVELGTGSDAGNVGVFETAEPVAVDRNRPTKREPSGHNVEIRDGSV